MNVGLADRCGRFGILLLVVRERPVEDMQEPHQTLGLDGSIDSRYRQDRKAEEFRDYTATVPAIVRQLYRENHTYQTREFVQRKKREYIPLQKARMGIWAAMDFLNTLVDDSDPDTSLSQIDHLLQTAEALRKDGRPRWMILTGLIHDLGKVLCLYGEPQWAVVGDTFPVGCAYSDRVVLAELLSGNPDSQVAEYQTRLGVYRERCGLSQVDMSWGHDEYLYHVMKAYLPEEALYIIRYHSFYAAHREHAYEYLMDDHDLKMLRWVREFSPYDLYSKSSSPPDKEDLRPFYEVLVAEFLPAVLSW
jgi:inositol oxygenase